MPQTFSENDPIGRNLTNMFSRGLWSAGQVRAREIAAGMEAEIDTLLKEAGEGPWRHGKLR